MIRLISVEDFLLRNPDYAAYLQHGFTEKGRLTFGFFKWNDTDACSWGGPWPGNLVLVTITDARIYSLNPLLPKGTYEDVASIECPVRLYLAGNDDTSYSCFLASIEEAETMLESIIVEPTWETLDRLGFVFTN